ncbi:hypothetical protein PMZ80_003414 [Knufia obscura]|uniref:U6 small nuclear RNA (adenine-(43)-N(6))-methyltransferase n=2 Tax=Knufia TaxID=430999 RepID=A0AAN8I7W8_9EURO|nr:hypothetical protein PMZ80_003414 [Knufia obscura]KAK5958667.1 hypothetical protein OHC33_000510 [Knufia fluminis]
MPAPPDIYQNEVDFTALALRYPDFAKKLKANRQLDFSDPESVRQLTKALLHRDFDLTISLPEDRLCPPVRSRAYRNKLEADINARFNYVLFVQRLLDSTQDNYNDAYDPNRKVIGIDIGTGASAIYPLLACRQRPPWLFLATEIDARSKEFAERNVKDNGLASRIKVIGPGSESNAIIPVAELERFERIDILLTNPPFYTSETELQALAKQKARPPNSACTGAPVEMICPGGEVSFVSQIVDESTLPANKTKIQWFSSMLGKLGSVTVIIDKLKETGCTNYAVTEFVQGQRTRRWCVAWSWLGLRPVQAVARGTDAVEKKHLPFPTEMKVLVDADVGATTRKLNEEFTKLDGMEWRWRSGLQAGIGRSMNGDVWSRHARRRQKRREVENHDSMDVETAKHDNNHKEEELPEPNFAFKIMVQPQNAEMMTDVADPTTTVLKLRWLQGQDSTLFESFHGWLKRKLTQ